MKFKLFGQVDERIVIAHDKSRQRPLLEFIIQWVLGKGVLTLNTGEPLELGRRPEEKVVSPHSEEDMKIITEASPDIREMVHNFFVSAEQAERSYNGIGHYSVVDLISQKRLGGIKMDGVWYVLCREEEPHQKKYAEENQLPHFGLQGINPVDRRKL